MGKVASFVDAAMRRVRGKSKLDLMTGRYLAAKKKLMEARQASGVDIQYGRYQREYQKKMAGTAKWNTLKELCNDPHVKASLRGLVLPMMRGTWEYVPADSENPQDVDFADLCNANLLGKVTDDYGMDCWITTSWRQRLYEITAFLEDGFSMFNSTLKAIETPKGMRMVYDKVHWLEPSTIDRWDTDGEDDIHGVYRKYRDATGMQHYDEYLEAQYMLLYTHELRGARYDGNPFVRPMFGPWFRKDIFVRAAAIWAQKVGAPPPHGFYPNDWSSDSDLVEDFIDHIMSLRGSSSTESFYVGPQGKDGKVPEIGYAGSQAGEVDRMRGLINGENAEIAHAGATKSQLLGETGKGSYAVGDVQSAMEAVLIEAVALTICDMENQGVGNLNGPVQVLGILNYGTEVRALPKLTVKDVDPYEKIKFYKEKMDAWKSGVIPKTSEARKQLCEPLGLRLPDDQYEIEEPIPPIPPEDEEEELDEDGNPIKKKDKGDDEEEELDEDGNPIEPKRKLTLSSGDDFKKQIQHLLTPIQEGSPPGGGFRYMNRLELNVVNLAEVGNAFRVGEQDITTVLRRVKRSMVDDLLGRLKSGKITPRNLESQQRSKFRGQKKTRETVTELLREVANVGAVHAEGEIAIQTGTD